MTDVQSIDPAKTPEAASGRVNWDHTYDLVADDGSIIKLPYLAPSFGEMKRLQSLSDDNATPEFIASTIERFMRRRIDAQLFEEAVEYMDTAEISKYFAFCQGTPKDGRDNTKK